MANSTFDVGTMLNGVAQFDQVIAAFAANMKANFDVQIAGLNASFQQTAANATAAFGIAATAVGASFIQNKGTVL